MQHITEAYRQHLHCNCFTFLAAIIPLADKRYLKTHRRIRQPYRILPDCQLKEINALSSYQSSKNLGKA